MENHKKWNYPATVEYSSEDEGWVARIPAFKNCTGFGESPEQAIAEAYDGLGGMIEVMEREKMMLPAEDGTVPYLRSIKPLIKISKLAEMSGMPASTLSSKIDRGGPFTKEEVDRLKSVVSLGCS